LTVVVVMVVVLVVAVVTAGMVFYRFDASR
jgi:hypothetical protein